jgi:hypothetical protein
MNKEFVPYEESLALKELGFDEPCNTCYDKLEMTASYGENVFDYKNYNTSGYIVSRPTFSQAFKWFREKYLLEGLILPQVQSILAPTPAYFIVVISYKDEIWEEKFNSSNDKDEKNFLHYGTPEEAELACLRKLIQIVKG